jgi:hypothetical protein
VSAADLGHGDHRVVFVASMSLRRADGPLTVHVPSAEADRPAWGRVGLIAAIGFVVGVTWPKLAGVRLGPSVPAPLASSAAPADSVEALAAPSAPVPAVMPVPVPSAAAPSARTAADVTVGRGSLFACKTASGDSLKGSECGGLPGLDDIVLPRLRKLGDCPEAATASGKLRLVVHPDFARGALGVELGRNQTVNAPEPLLACARTALAGANPAGVAHENPRYSVLYVASFEGSSAAQAESAPEPPAAVERASEGTAQVTWPVAIVRDAPKTGKVVARLQQGTSLRLGPVKDGWYPVKYGDAFSSEGWVYRGAIGR